LALIKALTRSALAMEFAALPLTLAPVAQPWLRRLAILGLAGLHLGIAATTTLGFFSVTMVATYALFLMPEDWDLFTRWPGARRLGGALSGWVVPHRPQLSRWLGIGPPGVERTSGDKAGANLEDGRGTGLWPRGRRWAVNLAH
jgi:hypothetical protein